MDIEAIGAGNLEAWNAHDTDGVVEHFAEQCVLDDAGRLIHGRAAIREYVGQVFSAMPDLLVHVHKTTVINDVQLRMLRQWTLTGTDAGRRIVLSGSTACTYVDGQVVEIRQYWDRSELERQLGREVPAHEVVT